MKASTFNRLVEAVGRETAEKLVQTFGGQRIYVPVAATSGSSISRVIGSDAAILLSQYFGGDRLDVPVDREFGAKRLRIRELLRLNLDLDEIARRVGCTRRYIREVLSEPHNLP